MNVGDERSRSVWMNVAVAPDAKRLESDASADTVVVGSGIAGLSTAYELAARGQTVIVLDRGAIGAGMTARTTAHLTSLCDDSFDSLISKRGVDVAKQFYLSQSSAIDRIEKIQGNEFIECDFRRLDGYLFPALGSDPSSLDASFEATQKAGMPVEDTKGIPFKGLEDVRCLRYPDQGAFHPLKYLRGLAAVLKKRDMRLCSETVVEEVVEEDGGVIVKTQEGHRVRAGAAVIATNSPINDRVAIHSKQAPYRTYAMAFELPHDSLPDALYWDTLDNYHYVRLQPKDGESDFLIVGERTTRAERPMTLTCASRPWKHGCGIFCRNWASRRTAGPGKY